MRIESLSTPAMESRQRGLSGQSSCNAHVKGTSECSSNELCCEKLNEEDDVGKQINDATEYYASTNASAGPWTVSRSANPLDDFEVLETLFQSQLSPTQVHLVEDRKSHETFVIKQTIKAKLLTEGAGQCAQIEARLHMKLDNINIVRLLDSWETELSYVLQLEFCNKFAYFE